MAVPAVLTGSASTLGEALGHAAQQFRDRPAFVDGDRVLSYRDWWRAAGGAATALADAGARPGTVVCIALRSPIEFAIAFAAAARVGATVTAVDPRLGPAELEGILARARPTVTVGAEDGRGAAVAARLGGVLVSGTELSRAADGPPAVGAAAVDAAAPAVIAWTSGTTGAPKGAWYPHRSLQFVAKQSGLLSAPFDRRLFATPLAHVGFLARVWDQLAWGITTVFGPRPWSAAGMLALLERERVTVGQGVPTQWEKVLALPGFGDADLSSLRVVATGATRVPPELVRAMRAGLGCPVLVRYACSEVPVALGTAADDPPEVAAETVGRPAVGVEAVVIDEDGVAVTAGAVGGLRLRSPGAMAGYWDDPAATAATVDEQGWIATGDLARFTPGGDVVIVGRRSEMYIRGGYNVHPLEVERTLLAHPDVAGAAVLGVRAPVIGEAGVAFVVLDGAPGPDTPEALRAWCRERLADYKVPDRVEVVPELPVNALGKIDKRALRQRTDTLPSTAGR